ncbi:MAG: hypothetical protein HY928_15525 [Elusimicrobia bacterium]|nr:hypothetical protein [Elusimicrobiota bacterium]
MTFLAGDELRYVDFQQRVFTEMVRRRIMGESEVRDMFLAFVGARRFEEARGLRSRYPSFKLPSIPDTVVPAPLGEHRPWGAYAISDEGRRAEAVTLPLGKGPHIVVAMWTGCSVTEHAIEDILGDPEVSDRFRQNGMLLTTRFDAVGVEKWKTRFGLRDVYVAERAGGFPGIGFLSSPGFYFLQDGKIVYEFKGWGRRPESSSRARLQKGFEALGL